MTDKTNMLHLQERRIEKVRDETPADLIEELLALFAAFKPVLDRLERDLAARR